MIKLYNKILETENHNWNPLILRVVLGSVIFAHGAQKLFGMWGGHGFSQTITDWEKFFNLPSFITISVILIESIGAILLIAGLFTRIMASLLGCVMLGAIIMLHAKVGFYMNWYGTQMGEGFEYHILVLGMVIALIISGGGKYSLDTTLSKYV